MVDDAPTLRPRHDGWTPARQAGFVAALTGGASIAAAAAAVGMSRRSAYRLRCHPAGTAVAAAWRGPAVPLSDDDFIAAIERGAAGRDAAFRAAEAAYPGGGDVWLLRQLRAESRRVRRRLAAARRRSEQAGRGVNPCDLPAVGRGADGRFTRKSRSFRDVV